MALYLGLKVDLWLARHVNDITGLLHKPRRHSIHLVTDLFEPLSGAWERTAKAMRYGLVDFLV